MIPAWLRERLALPVVAAPMFLVSGPDLVIAACRVGVVGAFPTLNCRTVAELDRWLGRIERALAGESDARGVPARTAPAPFAVNLVVHRSNARVDDDLAAVVQHRAPLVIASVGAPDGVVGPVHGYGGLVLADVATLRHARRAVAAGVDGLVLLTSGAGGQEGSANPFAFVRAVREFYDGLVLLAGCIADGVAIRAAEVLGADLAYIGTPFIAAAESLAPLEYREMLTRATMDDIIRSAAITGLSANFLRESLVAAGLDPARLGAGDLSAHVSEGLEQARWKRIWAAGQAVGAVREVATAARIVERLAAGYVAATAPASLPPTERGDR
jgi:nitronate monooxygenase